MKLAVPAHVQIGIGLGLAAVAVLYLLTRPGVARSVAQSAGSAAANTAGGLVEGAVKGIVGAPAGGEQNTFNQWGSDLGIWLYDVTHSEEKGGVW
jgi:hypothetical protein